MSHRVAVLCTALVVAVFAPARAADEKDDKKAAQGTWEYETLEWNGKKIPFNQIKMTTVTFDGDKFAIKIGDKVTSSGTHKFDSTKSPKTFDATVTDGEGRGTTMLGIYKLEGDSLTGCINLTGRERPTEFKTTENSETVLMTAKRAKK
ncbi:Uncharacterized protein OS=Pedosphaera parvula (strain Ellin514) GN=Cflav_PD2062 PE=4 SV=1 [Gemmata massiliana]|uniref:TIGR03067 domain-containing protein n=1 Tax=Gemmata massiliana TaxID=1210884 RepID=A0A6P2D1E1_9BACT|nr:TIGR03067 domain-containing protein [Gemmata massiliana]VTR93232.1 Uncharacterized protein OS=Pedosphaera parvula (strain Ellin514) GN=Cflav_PD2062 PE=4 SV=1 [Gemmata massiliana]